MFLINYCGLREATSLIDLKRKADPYKIVSVLKSGKILKKSGTNNEYFWKVLLKEMKLSD